MTRIAISPPAGVGSDRERDSELLRESPARALRPRRLEFRLDGGPGESSWRLCWRAGSLEYQTVHGAPDDAEEERTTALFSPSNRQWREFWRTVEELGVWRWAADHGSAADRGVPSWELALRHGEQELRSRGHGAWPGASSTGPSPEFGGFLAALRTLVDGREIG